MSKYAHVLKPLTDKSLPKYVIFFDTETRETHETETRRRLTLRLGNAVLTRRNERDSFIPVESIDFYKPNTFCRWINDRCTGRERYYIVAHNIAFDVRVVGILKYLTQHGWVRKSLIIDGTNFLATFRKGDTSLQFINNQQLFNVSLKSLGESIGCAKQEIDLQAADDTKLLEYCRQDVEVMRQAWNAWMQYIVVNDLGPFRMTAPSQAMAAYRTRFMQEPIYVHNDPRTTALERESYHGGRTECMFIGKWKGGDVYNLDVNSMYPHIMKQNKFPTKMRRYYKQIDLNTFARVRAGYGYIVDATVRVSKPVLPGQKEGRLIFPTGEISGVFTKPELENALRHGELLSVRRCAVYDERYIFNDFVDFFYKSRVNFRKSGNDAFAYVSKLLLNSLYGKFAQRSNVWNVIGRAKGDENGYYKSVSASSGDVETLRFMDGFVEKAVGHDEGASSCVSIASYVTASARVYLARLLERAGDRNVIYCDTDSLFVTEQGYNNLARLVQQDKLGKLKLVAVSSDVEIYGPKWYRFGEVSKSKGIRKDAVQVGKRVFEQDRFQSFNGALRSNDLDGVIVETIHKKLSTEYQKGIVTPSGFVIPFDSSSL